VILAPRDQLSPPRDQLSPPHEQLFATAQMTLRHRADDILTLCQYV
jgi:hypothetical protein